MDWECLQYVKKLAKKYLKKADDYVDAELFDTRQDAQIQDNR